MTLFAFPSATSRATSRSRRVSPSASALAICAADGTGADGITAATPFRNSARSASSSSFCASSSAIALARSNDWRASIRSRRVRCTCPSAASMRQSSGRAP